MALDTGPAAAANKFPYQTLVAGLLPIAAVCPSGVHGPASAGRLHIQSGWGTGPVGGCQRGIPHGARCTTHPFSEERRGCSPDFVALSNRLKMPDPALPST